MKKFKDAALPLLVCTSVFPSYTHAQPAPSPSTSQSISASWTLQNSGTTAGLRGIDAVDGSIAWASGANGTVLETIDGGEHWSPCAIPDADKDGATLDFRGIQAQDAETAIVMASGPGNKSRLYKTTDGCKSWVLVFKNPDAPEGFFASIKFHREQRQLRDHEGFGLLLGAPVKGKLPVFETRDGGHTWTRIENGTLANSTLAVEGAGSGPFAASNGSITDFGTDSNFLVTGGRRGSYLLRLNYQGTYWLNDASPLTRSWNTTSLPFLKGSDSAGVFAIRGRVDLLEDKDQAVKGVQYRLVAVGGDYTKPNENTATAAYSMDGGQHWSSATTPPHGYRSSVGWSSELKAWITVGVNGSDISRDDGQTWTPFPYTGTANGSWNSLSLPFVVGPKGAIARLITTAPASKP